MVDRGKGPDNGNKFTKCPYCGKNGAKLFGVPGDRQKFKCWHDHCPSRTNDDQGSWDEVGFLAYELGIPRKDAAIVLLKEAGLWQDREAYAASIMPGKAPRRIPPPSEIERPGPPHDLAPPAGVSPEEISAGPVSGSPGPGIEPVQDAGWVETPAQPSHESEPGGAETPSSAPADNQSGEGASVAPTADGAPGFPPVEPPSPPAGSPSNNPAGGSNPADAPRSPASPPAGSTLAGEPGAPGASHPPAAAQAMAGGPVELPPPGQAGPTNVVEFPGGQVVEPRKPAKVEQEAAPDLPLGTRGLREFYRLTALSAADAEKLWERRGFEWAVSVGLGFKSNPQSNRDILIALEQSLGFDEMEAAGLWTIKDRKGKKRERGPNAQFCGAGIIRRLKEGRAAKGQWTDKEGGNVWGWCEPILIPYFDENCELIGLRPHKGGAPSGTVAGTPRPYIPRSLDVPTGPEFYSTVIITEGEYKAVALWRKVGVGRKDGKPPWGVASLPGISMAKNEQLRDRLDAWLRAVKCNRVVVAFDNEEKADPRLASYKPEREKRFEAQKWARYLGEDLHAKLHVVGMICIIPNEWRNAQGKADWDGVLAQSVHQG